VIGCSGMKEWMVQPLSASKNNTNCFEEKKKKAGLTQKAF